MSEPVKDLLTSMHVLKSDVRAADSFDEALQMIEDNLQPEPQPAM
jgi:hypothetical protein